MKVKTKNRLIHRVNTLETGNPVKTHKLNWEQTEKWKVRSDSSVVYMEYQVDRNIWTLAEFLKSFRTCCYSKLVYSGSTVSYEFLTFSKYLANSLRPFSPTQNWRKRCEKLSAKPKGVGPGPGQRLAKNRGERVASVWTEKISKPKLRTWDMAPCESNRRAGNRNSLPKQKSQSKS